MPNGLREARPVLRAGTGSAATVVDVSRVLPRPRIVAIGTFDGVHRGHRLVVEGCDTVLTFHPHPRAVLAPGERSSVLTDRTRQLRRLASLGVSEVVVVPFDAAWARVPAVEFVDRVLVDRLSAEHVCVGANFRFGAQGAGSPQTLAADGRFGTSVVPLLVDAGEPVSSSRIRVLIDSGDVEQAAGLLGAPHIQPATRDGDGRLHFAPELAVPRSGDFEVLIDGTPGRWRPAQPPGAGAAGPGAETVEVTFLRPVGASR